MNDGIFRPSCRTTAKSRPGSTGKIESRIWLGTAAGIGGQTRPKNSTRSYKKAYNQYKTLADIALIPYVARLDYLGLLNLWTDGQPHVKDWWAQICARPSFKRGLYERITETEFNEMMTHGPKIRSDLVEIRVRNIKTSPGGSHFSMDGVKSDHLSSAYRVPLQFNGQSPRSSLQSRRYIFSPM